MAAVAAIVFIALYFVEAGYGMLFDKKWGLPIPNKIAWICMEAPVFIVMFLLWNGSERQFETVPFLIFLFFELHYFQRSFIFPLLIKGKSKMPAGIMLMGITFNLLNGYMQAAQPSIYSRDNLVLHRHGNQYPVRPYCPPPQKAWRHEPLSAPKRPVQICDISQLLWRNRGMVRICNPDLECKRSCFRLVDICKPCTSRKHHLP